MKDAEPKRLQVTFEVARIGSMDHHIPQRPKECFSQMLGALSCHEVWLFCHIRIFIVPAKLVIVLEIFQSLLETGTNNSRCGGIQRHRTP